jgi:hypothetical protein
MGASQRRMGVLGVEGWRLKIRARYEGWQAAACGRNHLPSEGPNATSPPVADTESIWGRHAACLHSSWRVGSLRVSAWRGSRDLTRRAAHLQQSTTAGWRIAGGIQGCVWLRSCVVVWRRGREGEGEALCAGVGFWVERYGKGCGAFWESLRAVTSPPYRRPCERKTRV